jgi:hypothetical protein
MKPIISSFGHFLYDREREFSFRPLLNWESLPSNFKFVKDNRLSMPCKDVVDVFVKRLNHYGLIAVNQGFRDFFNRQIDTQHHKITVTFDMVIDFMRACTFFKGQVISNPSILVRMFLEEWHRMDEKSYFAYINAMELSDISPLPHLMPLMNFEASADIDKLSNLRCWRAARMIGSVEDDQVPNIFEVDYVCRIKGGLAFKIFPEGIWVGSRPSGLYQCAVIADDGTVKKINKLITAGMDKDFSEQYQSTLDSQATEGVDSPSSNSRPGQMRGSYTQQFGDGG